LQRFAEVLSDDERERMQRLRLPRHRHDYLVSHALVRAALSRCADVAPGAWTFRANRHGRPEIGGPVAAAALRFNLSHTDGLVACAVTLGAAVGVDVENSQRPLRLMAVAKRFFHAAEAEDLGALPAERRAVRFFTYWTLKEAYVKARGEGLSLPLQRIRFHLAGAGDPSVSFGEDLRDDPRRWRFVLLRPSTRHVLALAVESRGEPAIVHRHDGAKLIGS
jgi:4'-phosphopantetheinyl transferase